jgi:ferric-dicitrate binding protein FerR (iron transport regulator)
MPRRFGRAGEIKIAARAWSPMRHEPGEIAPQREHINMTQLTEVESQAAWWLVRYGDPGCSLEERGEFQAWLAQSPEHWKTYNEMKRDSADVLHDLRIERKRRRST